MNSSVHFVKNEGPPSCVGARGRLDAQRSCAWAGRSHPLRSWDKCVRLKLTRPIAPPKGVDSVLEHFPSKQHHLIPPTCG